MSDTRKPCHFCAELIKLEAIVCPYCRRDQRLEVPATGPSLASHAGEEPSRAERAKEYDVEVVGESRRQDLLMQLAGGRMVDSANTVVRASLRIEADNPVDPEAVIVEIDGRCVGYLPRPIARRLREKYDMAVGLDCTGVIRGGWVRDGRVGSFGIWLASGSFRQRASQAQEGE